MAYRSSCARACGRAAGRWLCSALYPSDRRFRPSFSGLLLVFVFYYLLLGWCAGAASRIDSMLTRRPAFTVLTIDATLAGRPAAARSGARPQCVLPWSPLGLSGSGRSRGMTRASLLKSWARDFVRTARGPRLPRRRCCGAYASANALVADLNTVGWCLVPAWRQCPGREGIRLARGRRLRDPGVAGDRTLPGARVCPGHGAPVLSGGETWQSTCHRLGRSRGWRSMLSAQRGARPGLEQVHHRPAGHGGLRRCWAAGRHGRSRARLSSLRSAGSLAARRTGGARRHARFRHPISSAEIFSAVSWPRHGSISASPLPPC